MRLKWTIFKTVILYRSFIVMTYCYFIRIIFGENYLILPDLPIYKYYDAALSTNRGYLWHKLPAINQSETFMKETITAVLDFSKYPSEMEQPSMYVWFYSKIQPKISRLLYEAYIWINSKFNILN